MNRSHLLTVRISEERRKEFKVASELIGVPMSSLVHQRILDLIRETQAKYPAEFNKVLAQSVKGKRKKRLAYDLT